MLSKIFKTKERFEEKEINNLPKCVFSKPFKQSFLMSRSYGCATARNFSDFAQNLEIFMHKLRMYAITPLLTFFLHDSHLLSDVIFALFPVHKFHK